MAKKAPRKSSAARSGKPAKPAPRSRKEAARAGGFRASGGKPARTFEAKSKPAYKGGPPAAGKAKSPPLLIQPTTLWDYPSQHYGDREQGSSAYRGATPSYIIWNLIQRYTFPGDTVLDPCCGSGTTIDVCQDTDRKGLGFDVAPARADVQAGDARELPLAEGSVDFVFIDPPYAAHLDYSDDPRCIGKTQSADGSYLRAMADVIAELHRVLKPGGYLGLYVSDSYEKGTGPTKGFFPIGFDLFGLLREHFEPVDIISVTRHNRTLEMGNYRRAAEEGNFYLRGFNYLFIMRKAGQAPVLHGKQLPGA